MVPIEIAGPRNEKDSAAFVISDTMQPVRNMLDGKFYDSKSKFRSTTRAYGCEEVGTDKTIMRDPRERRIDMRGIEQDVKRAIQEIASR
jgi:hypothetical protein